MPKSASKRAHRPPQFFSKGPQASRLRQRKYALVRHFGFPEDLLGGALSLTHRRCGKAGCRCASGELHPMWTLTYSVDGARRVDVVPHDQVAELEPLAQRWREHFDALRELGAINAQLLRLWRQEQRERKKKTGGKRGQGLGRGSVSRRS